MLIDWLIDGADLALSVYFQISELTFYMPRKVGMSTETAVVSIS